MTEQLDIDQLLNNILALSQESRILFWYDAGKQFEQALESLATQLFESRQKIELINLSGRSTFQVKKMLERDQPEQNFLIYAPYAEPTYLKNPLLDIQKYSKQFYADRSAIILSQLGLTRMVLKDHIGARSVFFNSKERLESLKRWIEPLDDEQSIDLKLIAVTVKAQNPQIADIVRTVLNDYANIVDQTGELNSLPKVWKKLTDYNLVESFWQLVTDYCGYQAETLCKASCYDFALKLFCTDLSLNLGKNIQLRALEQHYIQQQHKTSVDALMRQWRDDRRDSKFYNLLARRLESELGISSQLDLSWQEALKRSRLDQVALLSEFSGCETFLAVDRFILLQLREQLQNFSLYTQQQKLPISEIKQFISKRENLHWVNANLTNYATHSTFDQRNDFGLMYQAFVHAFDFIQLKNEHIEGFTFRNASEMYKAYQHDLFRFDQSYRRFNQYANVTQNKGHSFFDEIAQLIETTYVQWYMRNMSLAWDQHIAQDNLMTNWQIQGVHNQFQFYQKYVDPILNSGQVQRIFVVVSDALRYEVAEQLAQEIQETGRFNVETDSILGVLPSYTQLGKAVLLPVPKHPPLITYKDGQKTVFIDGKSSAGVDGRSAILQAVDGVAIDYVDLKSFNKSQLREFTKPYKIVYIYHNTIDDHGDSRKTQHDTIDVCARAINELNQLISRLMGDANASRILVTADHGFLYQQSDLDDEIKKPLPYKPDNLIEYSKRFTVGKHLHPFDDCWFGSVKDTANGDDTSFLLPKLNQRFHFVGGEKFVHGGASLQEICVPVLEFRSLRTQQRTEVKPVDFQILDRNLRFTNTVSFVRTMQTSIVGEHTKSTQIEFYIKDINNQVLSSVVTQDYDATEAKDFEKLVRINLIGRDFDSSQTYFLIAKNLETNQVTEYPLQIDIIFDEDIY
ncbi:BREX-1 system phosphatase PglZ type A [Acinetobacter sp. SWBY1]|uniref:BREX-1 system phosphatase PglZ type A n=1 Tax=Acinetobacter sp. SWBY1 TaxID=2079596 RepID=UPI000CF22323|nr:BREX-1 system phosphatase PglZ type A [Acinetobacter sp. SWBY1]AVH48966.1 BREX-1 system phosphatase PglZ type A [Acinetobacter sp. SWBY1]